MNKHLQEILNLIQEDETLSTEQKAAVLKSLKDADKELEITTFKLDRTEKVKRTTAILLEETIEELEQKRKAVEAQNKELEIESSLERVRSVAMSMYKPDDMLEVCRTISHQLELLAVKEIRNVQTAIFYESKGTYMNYEYYAKHDKTFITETAYTNHDIPRKFAEQMLKGKDGFFESHIEKPELPGWLAYQKTTNVFIDSYLEEASSLNYYWFSLGPVALGISTYNPLKDDEINLFKRFRNVFELSYRRFLDIEKAAAQAREAQIELALERVRARTMAMQRSDELKETSSLLFKQVDELGIKNWSAGFNIWDPSGLFLTDWMTSPAGGFLDPYKIPLNEFWLWKESTAAKLRGEEFLEIRLDGEKLKEGFTYLSNLPDAKEKAIFQSISLAGFQLPESVVNNYAFFSQGSLLFVTYEPVPEAHDIFKRFAKVFEQTYTRFLDLQKAEEQAREAKIEAALEKVRSRSLAMHKSDELNEVVTILFEKIKELQIPVTAVGIGIYIDGSKDMNTYVCGENEDRLVINNYCLPYFHHKIWKDLNNAREKQLDFFSGNYSKEEKNSFYKYVVEHSALRHLPDDIKSLIFDSPAYTISIAPVNHSMFMINDFKGKILSENEVDIIKRFARVFDQAYTRFLDLQKAEARAREAKIEAALERTRTQSMIMQHSKELDDVLRVFHEQVLLLGVNSAFSFLWLPDENKDRHIFWAVWGEGKNGSTVFKSKAIDYPLDRNEPATAQCLVDWKGNEPVVSYQVPPAGVESYFAAWQELIDGVEQLKPEFFSDGLYYVEAFMKYGCFGVIAATDLTGDEKKILGRFAIEFERTYTRFLDLQKAEAQAREAQIEVSLERVRSKTMAMHNSNDVGETVIAMFAEFTHLGIHTNRCGILIFIDEHSSEVWTARSNPEGKASLIIGKLILDSHNLLSSIYKAWKAKNSFYKYDLIGDDLVNYYDAINRSEFYRTRFDMNALPSKEYHSDFFFAEGAVFAFTGEPIAEEHTKIIKRFASVFGQTYRRYLDLQKAEAQARDAQIETALERVRSRSMGMHKSEELKEVIQVVYEQFVHLKVNTEHTGFVIDYKERDDRLIWVASKYGVPSRITIPYFDSVYYNSFNEAKEKGLDFFATNLSFEEKNIFYKELFTHIPGIPEEDRKFYFNCPGLAISTVLLENVGLYIENFEGITYSDEDNAILMRFGKVFQQTYTRFLDLQRAEAQARESQIEAALERVRSRSMGMQKSDELTDVAGLLFAQVTALGIKTWTAGFNVWSEDNNSYVDYITSPAGGFIEPYTIHSGMTGVLKEVSDARKSGVEFFVQYAEGERLKQTYLALSKCADEKQYEIMLQDGFQFPSHQYDHFVFGSKVSLMFITYEPVPESHDIFKRFGKVFEQTYTRFLDIQKAEAQALEAIKRASVDRVRAEIASMRTTKDLERIQPLIWNELTTLSVPFIRCGVFIMDEEQQLVHTFLSTPEGKAIATLHVPFQFDLSIIANGVIHWRRKEMYKEYWDATAFTRSWIALSSLSETPGGSHQQEHPPENLYLHMLPFLQGMLYVGNDTPLDEVELQLVQNLADAFATAYARYEDFNKLESAKKQVDSTLNELQATQKQLIQSEKMASLGELTAGIAHEIQNPLNFVNNFSEVNTELIEELKNELKGGNTEEVIAIANDIKANEEKINHHGKRADAIVKGMLQHSRSTGNVKEPVDINVLADEYLRLAYHGLRAKDKSFNATLKTEYNEKIKKINIIPQDIGRVILNIITNAFYTVNEKKKVQGDGYEPTVSIITKKVGENVEIKIVDNGNGIPQKVVDKIFQPFFTTKPTGQGTGLGLSLAYDIIKAHGGEIKVETKEGEGSAFFIVLPQ